MSQIELTKAELKAKHSTHLLERSLDHLNLVADEGAAQATKKALEIKAKADHFVTRVKHPSDTVRTFIEIKGRKILNYAKIQTSLLSKRIRTDERVSVGIDYLRELPPQAKPIALGMLTLSAAVATYLLVRRRRVPTPSHIPSETMRRAQNTDFLISDAAA